MVAPMHWHWWLCANALLPKTCWFESKWWMGWNTNGLYRWRTMLEGTGHASVFCVLWGTHYGTEWNPQAKVVEVIWTGYPHYSSHQHIAPHTCLQLSRRHKKPPAVHPNVQLQGGAHHCIWGRQQYQQLLPQFAFLERWRIRHPTYCSLCTGLCKIGLPALYMPWRWRVWTISSTYGVWILRPPIKSLQNSWSPH